jgi:AcrR family transcriptional regulator
LTVEGLVDAAIGLVDENGLEDLSMPKLARRLDVGTMTLYGYVANKQDLLDRMAARVLDGIELPDSGPWEHRLTMFFSRFRRAALAHPTLSGLLATGRITIPKVFDTLETLSQAMIEAGFSADAAIRTFYSALAYTLGFVIWETPRTRLQPESDYRAEWNRLLDQLDPDRYPVLTGPVRDRLATVASDEQFEWGLAFILRIEHST